jgi:hypothetical protein
LCKSAVGYSCGATYSAQNLTNSHLTNAPRREHYKKYPPGEVNTERRKGKHNMNSVPHAAAHVKKKYYTPDAFERARLDMREVAAFYGVTIDRHGRGRCPIHGGDNPSSFCVKGAMWHCFVCNAGGDAVAFVQALYGLPRSVDALEMLDRHFVLGLVCDPLHRPDPEQVRREREQRELKQARNAMTRAIMARVPLALEWGADTDAPFGLSGYITAQVKARVRGFTPQDASGLCRALQINAAHCSHLLDRWRYGDISILQDSQKTLSLLFSLQDDCDEWRRRIREMEDMAELDRLRELQELQ